MYVCLIKDALGEKKNMSLHRFQGEFMLFHLQCVSFHMFDKRKLYKLCDSLHFMKDCENNSYRKKNKRVRVT